MAASISTIKAGSAEALAQYYGKEANERYEELADRPENIGRPREELMLEARVQVAREDAEEWGRDPDEAEKMVRKKVAEAKVDGAAAYYAAPDGADAEEPEDRRRWVRGDRAGETITTDQMKDMFLGQDEHGQRLDDPRLQSIQKAARDAGYEGPLTGEVIESLRHGQHPETGEVLTGEVARYVAEKWQAPERNNSDVTAVDLTLSAPKAVSVMAAFCDRETSEAIIAAQQRAGEAALQSAEQQGMVRARRGTDGNGPPVAGQFLQAGQITEMTSRAGDPHLHTHTTCSAFVLGEDGRRSALDGQAWMGASAGINALYLRHLSQEMEAAIGVGLNVGEDGRRTEVAGIDQETLQQYSTRSVEMRETIAERTRERDQLEQIMGGSMHLYEDSYRAQQREDVLTEAEQKRAEVYAQWLASGTTPQQAALSTRSSKEEEGEESARARWADDPQAPVGTELLRDAQQAHQAAHAEAAEWTEEAQQAFIERLAEDLTAGASQFSAKEAYTKALHMAPAGVDEQAVIATTDRFLAETAVLTEARETERHVGDVWRDEARRFTTEEVIAEQEQIVARARSLASQRVSAMEDYDVRRAAELAESYTLGEDQEQLLGSVLTGQRLCASEGPAGAGKSHALSPVSEIAHQLGAEVTVLSVKADLAAELGADIGADRAMSLQKATMRSTDPDNIWGARGAFEAGYWAQGLSEDQQSTFHDIQRMQREATTDRQREKADKAMREWQEGLPTKADAERTETKRDRLEKTDKAAKRAKEWGSLPTGKLRQDLYETRQELIEEAAEQPDAFTQIDYSKPQIVIVDEAAMGDNRHWDRVTEWAAQHENIQLVTTGDSAQLAAIGRAGAYRAMMEQAVEPVELQETRRAQAEWEREAQLEMRGLAYDDSEQTHEQAAALVETYDQQGRLDHIGDEEVQQAIAAGKAEASHQRADLDLAAERAADWWMQNRSGDSLVMTPTRQMQARIAEGIQQRRIADKEDTAMSATARRATLYLDETTTQEVQVGEPVTIRINLPTKGLRNGMQGQISAVKKGGGVTVQCTDERGKEFKVAVSRRELEKDHAVALGYTATAHKAQGQTVDRALFVHDTKSGFVDRHMTYPAMTRGKYSNETLLVGGADREEALDALARSMHHSEAPGAIPTLGRPVTDEERAQVRHMFPQVPAEKRDDMVMEMRQIDARQELERQSQDRVRRTQQLAAARAERGQRRGVGMAA